MVVAREDNDMADISKCSNSKCPRRYGCYRVTAKDGIWQSYSYFTPEENGDCAWFIPINGCGCSEGECTGDCKYWEEKDIQD